MTALESQIAEVLAYQHCRMTNSKADHPIFGYHAFSEEQREYLRSVMMPAAQAVAAMLAPVIREAQAEALREAAGAMGDSELINHWEDSDVTCDATASEATQDWLRARADKLVTDE